METKIKLLKSSSFKDNVKNPLLSEFDFSQFDNGKNQAARDKCEEIVLNEEVIFATSDDPVQQLKQKMIALGMNNIFIMSDILCDEILRRIKILLEKSNLDNIHILDKLQYLFVKGLESHIQDKEFLRLKNDQSISYYKMFFDRNKKSLKEKIALEILYFEKKSSSSDSKLYIGTSYGEIPYDSSGRSSYNNVYIDLRTKSKQQMANIAIIKQKIEEDFVGFKIHMFFQLMLDYEIITQDSYNIIVYGTTDKKKLSLVKMGLNINIINRLDDDNQLHNISIDRNNNLIANNEFYKYKEDVDDFYRFQLSKFL